MSSIWSIVVSMKLLMSLWEEIIRTVAYLKNRSPSQKRVTLYEKANGEKTNLKYLRVIGSKIQVNISEKRRNKLNNRVWQAIFMSYEGTNVYRIYYLLIEKIHKTQDVDIDKDSLYDRFEVNL